MDGTRAFFRMIPPVNFTFADATETDILYKHFTQESGKLITTENVAGENLDKIIPTVVLIHGWMADDTSPWYDPLRDEYFKLGPHNIIYVNWNAAASKSYDVACANIKPVGKFVAEFLIASEIPLENIHVIGHSLGCHLSSFVGKEVFEIAGKKIGRITGLDPAGPKFENSPMAGRIRLNEADADFVDVIHTDIQLFGYTAPIGHVDFYPNEGKHQPGCPIRKKDANCSHLRPTLYFLESISRECKARQAIFKEINHEVKIMVVDGGKEVIFGHHVDKSARGIFYFKTNPEAPFLC